MNTRAPRALRTALVFLLCTPVALWLMHQTLSIVLPRMSQQLHNLILTSMLGGSLSCGVMSVQLGFYASDRGAGPMHVFTESLKRLQADVFGIGFGWLMISWGIVTVWQLLEVRVVVLAGGVAVVILMHSRISKRIKSFVREAAVR